MSTISSSNYDENSSEETDYNEVDNMILSMVAVTGIVVGQHAMKFLCKQPCRTNELTGYKWVQEILNGNDKRCHENFRMDKHLFLLFCNELVQHGLKGTKRIGIQEMVAMFLLAIGHGEGNRIIQERFQHSGETVSRHFHNVLTACLKLSCKMIRPQDYTFKNVHTKIQDDNRYWPYFKDCIGAIDGTHVPCVVPSKESVKYIGRKGYTSQNVMAVCDWDMCFIFTLSGWEGSAHDARVFKDALTKTYYNFPHPPLGKYYLVDSGYPTPVGYLGPYRCERYHLPDFRRATGFRNRDEMFNFFHSSLRCTIERTFGVWKNRFAVLRHMPSFKYDTQVKIVCATMAIHNFIRRNSVSDIEFQLAERDGITMEDLDSPNNVPRCSDVDLVSSVEMSCLRDSIRDEIVADQIRN